MAATRLIPLHTNKGKSAAASLKERLDYSQDPEKTEDGKLISSYACDPRLAWEEFMLEQNRYLTAHRSLKEKNVIAYQIRQSFKPGEVSPEEANKIGYELAMRFTKGKHAFTVSTHTDRAHVHNHVIFSAVDLKGEKKFRNFFLSTYAVRRLSDVICVEHGLSIIDEKPKREWQYYKREKTERSAREMLRMDLDEILEHRPGSFEEILQELKERDYEIKQGKHISVRHKSRSGFIRFRSLGEGYTEEDLKAAIETVRINGDGRERNVQDSAQRFSLMKDFEQILQQKKGKGYERWALHFNNTQAAEVLIFLQENNIDSYEKLDALADGALARFHAFSDEIRSCEARLKEIANLKKAITDYSKTRNVYEAYRKAGYSKKFFEEHRAEIMIHKAAKKVFDSLPDKRIPKMKELSAEYSEMLEKKKAAYREYRTAKNDMKNYTIARKNVAMLLDRESVPERNAQPSRET